MTRSPSPRRLSTFQIIIFGFLLLILLGSLLLTLPIATRGGTGASFSDAFFTATSAVCVTGLVVRDTATYWSLFGQLVLLLLIQIGGLGVVTVAVSAAMLAGRKIGLMQRSVMQEAIAAPHIGGVVRLTAFILKVVAAIELLGAAALAPVFCREFGVLRGLWYALFHSISAFCNAGFDLMGVREPFSSLTTFAAVPSVNVTVMLLILVGGIGFLTWEDVRRHGVHLGRYRMQSKVILLTTAVLLLLPALYFYFYEFASPAWAHLSGGERVWLSLFQSVTPRTAGFNTAPLTALSEPGQAVTMLLMLIGGSPGSTAGGMKTTTIAVLAASAVSVFRRGGEARLFRRRVSPDAVRSAAAILLLYLVLFLTAGLVISCVESLPLLPCLFEAASAIGTVGLTLGHTPQLCAASRWILTALMFLGRVGGLTLVYATVSFRRATLSRYPQEHITVG